MNEKVDIKPLQIFSCGENKLMFRLTRKTGDALHFLNGRVKSIEYLADKSTTRIVATERQSSTGYDRDSAQIEISSVTPEEHNKFIDIVAEYYYNNEFANKL